MSTPHRCFITDEMTSNHMNDEGVIGYSITYLNQARSFRYSNDDWRKILDDDRKNIFKSFLWNNQWPIEEDTLITPNLIHNILRFDIYPKTFKEKMFYCLEFLYKNGGDEYKPQDFNLEDYPFAFAKDRDEFFRIISGLKSKKLIRFKDKIPMVVGVIESKDIEDVLLTEEGIRKVELVIKERNKTSFPKYFPSGHERPSVMICGDKKDEIINKKIQEQFLHNGFTIQPLEIDSKNGYSEVLNSRATIYNEIHYFVFIKSYTSDNNNAAGELQTIAIETAIQHSQHKPPFQFFYTAFVDDSPVTARPRLQDFNCCDARIIPMREKMINQIKTDWYSRLNFYAKQKEEKNAQEKEYFNEKEITEMNGKIDLVLVKLEKLGLGQEIIFEEIEDLKKHINSLNKKNWVQILTGKLMEAVFRKAIDQTLASDILKDLMGEAKKLVE